jgi:tRNA(Ile2) C34 agmatinyltransferase TiaS
VAYCYFAIKRYYTVSRKYYICGNCGKHLTHKGKCPECGYIND